MSDIYQKYIQSDYYNKDTKAAGIVSLITGIVSWFMPFPLWLVWDIVSIIFGNRSALTDGSKMGKVGKVLAIINLIVNIVISFIILSCLVVIIVLSLETIFKINLTI